MSTLPVRDFSSNRQMRNTKEALLIIEKWKTGQLDDDEYYEIMSLLGYPKNVITSIIRFLTGITPENVY